MAKTVGMGITKEQSELEKLKVEIDKLSTENKMLEEQVDKLSKVKLKE